MLSELLKEKRLEAGLSQKELADQLGYSSPQFVSNWERGLSSPPPGTIVRICKVMKIDGKEFQRKYIDAKLVRVRADLEKKFSKAKGA